MLIPIIVAVLLIPGLLFFGGKIRVERQEKEEIEKLKSLAADLSGQIYREEQLEGLPEPVQRYFRHVLKDGQSYVSSVRLAHNGEFKTSLDREWISIEGEQFFTAEEPGFLWVGKTALFTARDMYISGKGRIVVSLLSLFKMVEGKGEIYDQGELLRWLGESVWFPTNFLPRPELQWQSLDKDTALLSFQHRGMSLDYRVSFNEKGEITELETQRHMGNEGLKTWIGRLRDYEEASGMKVPMIIEALWKLDGEEHSYARFNVTEIHHN